MKKKNILIPWSGGFDSTALIINQLINTKNKIYLARCNFNNNNAQTESELKAMKKMLKIFKSSLGEKKFNKRFRNHEEALTPTFECKLNDDSVLVRENSFNLFQQIFVASMAPRFSKDIDEIQLGYVKDDSFWHHSTEILDIYKRVMTCTYADHRLGITIPFEWWSKTQMLELYSRFDAGKDILKNISVCQSGNHWRTDKTHVESITDINMASVCPGDKCRSTAALYKEFKVIKKEKKNNVEAMDTMEAKGVDDEK